MNKYLKYAAIGIAAGFINGLLGAGGGTLVVPALERVLKVEEHNAHATAIFIITVFTIFSLFFYVTNVELDYYLILQISCGGVVGGVVGAKLLARMHKKYIRKIFGGFLIIAAIGMILR